MKRRYFILSMLTAFAFSIFSPSLFAQSARLTTAKMKEICKSRVIKAENGDVYFEISRAPMEVLKVGKDINPSIIDWLAYYDPNYDYDKLNKLTVREAGKGSSGPRSMTALLDAIVDFMGSNNVKLRPVKFSPNNARNRIENGQPYLLSISLAKELDKVKQRTAKRKTFTDMKAWQKVLRESEIKKFGEGNFSQYAQLTGFNKQTGEFQISIGSRENFWMTEDEIKDIAWKILEPRL